MDDAAVCLVMLSLAGTTFWLRFLALPVDLVFLSFGGVVMKVASDK